MRTRIVLIVGLLGVLLLGNIAQPTPLCCGDAVQAEVLAPSMPWWVISAGGGHSVGGAFTLDGGVVQPAGAVSGGHYQLGSGFWYGLLAPAAPPPPTHWLHLPVILKNVTK